MHPLDFSRLEKHATKLRDEFSSAAPWQHLVIDDFLDPAVATRVAAAFPPFGQVRAELARFLEARSYGIGVHAKDPLIAEVFAALYSPRFISFLEVVTGIVEIIPDTELLGAGLHQGARGSRLRVHADHNTHPRDATSFRRVNLLIYLTQGWQAEWNGDLELWDRSASTCERRIAPRFNRCAILGVDDTAFHGYGPLRLPEGRTRNAIAAYYYARSAAPGQAADPHPTLLPSLRDETVAAKLGRQARGALLASVEALLPNRYRANRLKE